MGEMLNDCVRFLDVFGVARPTGFMQLLFLYNIPLFFSNAQKRKNALGNQVNKSPDTIILHNQSYVEGRRCDWFM